MSANPNDSNLTDFDALERDSFSTRVEYEAIVKILKSRFPDFPESASSLEPLSAALDLETLNQIFQHACRAPNFSAFCNELDALWSSRDAQAKTVDEERRRELATAQIFNNFIVQILEKRRKIGASFLRRHVGEISPKVAQELDFDAYETEPTVHIFGAQVSRLCDLVFSIPFKDRSQGAQAVAVPLEHKSTQTRNVVLQLLTSLILVLQYIQRHKERFRRKDKKFVWPFLLLFYTGAKPWEKVLNFPDLFATPDEELDKLWIFKLPFKFVSLFARSKEQIEDDPWLEAFFELTKAAERIVAQKDATAKDWEKAWDGAFNVLKGKIDPTDEEGLEICGDFLVFVSKVAIRQGWEPPTRKVIMQKMENLGGVDMTYKIESLHDIWRIDGERTGEQRGEQRGKQETLHEMLKKCITLRFPKITQSTVDAILAITDLDLLKSIFTVACTADSLDRFQKDVQKITPVF